MDSRVNTNWLKKYGQRKPMAVPWKRNYPQRPGEINIDKLMEESEAQKERQRGITEFVGSGQSTGIGGYPDRPDRVVRYIDARWHNDLEVVQQLLNNPLPCVVQVYNLRQVNNRLWAAEVERVKPLDESEKQPFNTVDLILSNLIYEKEHHYSIRNVNLTFAELVHSIAGPSLPSGDAQIDFSKPLFDLFDECIQHIGNNYLFTATVDLYKCMLSNNFRSYDVHAGNVGWKVTDGRRHLVLLDLGGSRFMGGGNEDNI